MPQPRNTKPLYPAEAQKVFLALPDAPAAVVSGNTPGYAVVADASEPVIHRCRTDNHASKPVSGACSAPK